MELLPEQLVVSTLSLRLVILLMVLLVERHFRLNDAYHPATLFRYISLQLALKVNKRGAKQQAISGMLSGIIMLSLVMGLTVTILFVAITQWFFEGIFLLLALKLRPYLIAADKVKLSLVKQQKHLAREQLATLCVRDTDSLSTMGIVKATIESLIQRPTQSYFNIIFYYALLGIHIAIAVAVINALAAYWNPKKQSFRHFGRLFSDLAKAINTPMQYIMLLLCGVLFGFKPLTLKPKQWHNKTLGALLTTASNLLNRELGGAVMYDKLKIRRPKLGPSHPPEHADIGHSMTIVKKLQQAVLAILLFSLAASIILSNL